MKELIGQTLGQYQIEAQIGQGGMASVFKAYQPSLDRYVAIKVLPPSFANQNPVFRQRFQREARAIARLHHPNILPVYDFGLERDYHYIVMRYVEGAQTLSQVMARPLSQLYQIELLIQAAHALASAHQQGIVHRDVKPSNILIDQNWALLSDFGLAQTQEEFSRLTDTGKRLGTPAYMSPEQARGQVIDQRTDIYALGAILFEIMTRTIPHNAPSSLTILLKRTTEPPPSARAINPAISRRMEQVILRALAVDPQDRYAEVAAFIMALSGVLPELADQQAAGDDLRKQTQAVVSQLLESPEPIQAAGEVAPESEAIRSDRQQIWMTTAGQIPARVEPHPVGDNKRVWPISSRPVWLTGLMLTLTMATLIFSWQGGIFEPAFSKEEAAQAVPLLTTTPTSTPTSTLTPTPAPTRTALPPTATPSPSPSPTNTPSEPTATPLIIVVTATSLPPASPTFRPAASPTLTEPTLTPNPTPELLLGEFRLLHPSSLEEPSYGPTEFEWEWQGPVPPDTGFEVRVWREDEFPAGVHDAVLDNQEGRIEQVGENRYRLTVDIREAFGVRGRSGEYLWTVALVQIHPSYADLDQKAEPGRLRFEAGGGSSNGGNNDGQGGSNGGVIR